MHLGAELGLAAFGATAAAALAGQLVALRFNEGAVEAFFEETATGTDVTAGPGDLVLWAIAEGASLIQQRLAFQHLGWLGCLLFDEHRCVGVLAARLCRSQAMLRKGNLQEL